MSLFFEQNYILIIILGVGTILSYIWVYFFNKEKLQLNWWQALLAVLSATAIGVLALHFFALMESGFDFNQISNLSFFGGIFVTPLFAFVLSKIKKIPVGTILDVFTVMLVILAFGRINCLINGCCYGNYIGDSDIRYPTREIEIGYDVIFLGIAIFLNMKNLMKGKVYFLYLMSYGLLRFIIEFMRHTDTLSVFHIGHTWALLSLLAGTGLFIYLTIKEKNESAKTKKK